MSDLELPNRHEIGMYILTAQMERTVEKFRLRAGQRSRTAPSKVVGLGLVLRNHKGTCERKRSPNPKQIRASSGRRGVKRCFVGYGGIAAAQTLKNEGPQRGKKSGWLFLWGGGGVGGFGGAT